MGALRNDRGFWMNKCNRCKRNKKCWHVKRKKARDTRSSKKFIDGSLSYLKGRNSTTRTQYRQRFSNNLGRAAVEAACLLTPAWQDLLVPSSKFKPPAPCQRRMYKTRR